MPTPPRWRVHLGDSLPVLHEWDAESIDAVVTDPPYSSGGLHTGERQRPPNQKYQNSETKRKLPNFHGDGRDQRSWRFWCSWWLLECYRLTRPGGAVAVFSDWRQIPSLTDALQAAGYIWRGIVPWDKVNGRPTPGRFRNQAEFVVWGSKGPMRLDRDAPFLPGVLRGAPPPTRRRVHLTEKPVVVMRDVVRICERGGRILDPFCGGGSIGVAAIQEGFAFEGIDIEPANIETTRERLAEAMQLLSGAVGRGTCRSA